jgi:hypothetical protein
MRGIYLHFPYTPTRTGIWTREQIYLGIRCGPVRGSITAEGEILRIHLDRPWVPPSLLGAGSLSRGVEWTTHTSSAEVKERVSLHLLPLWGFVACSKAKITLFFNILIIAISRF